MQTDTLVLIGLTPGRKAKLTRIALGLRQIDVAFGAGVSQGEVSAFERSGDALPGCRRRVERFLGIEDGS